MAAMAARAAAGLLACCEGATDLECSRRGCCAGGEGAKGATEERNQSMGGVCGLGFVLWVRACVLTMSLARVLRIAIAALPDAAAADVFIGLAVHLCSVGCMPRAGVRACGRGIGAVSRELRGCCLHLHQGCLRQGWIAGACS